MTLNDAQTVIFTLALVLLGVGFVLRLLPVAECSECPHCQNRHRHELEERKRREHDKFHSLYGRDACPTCNPPPDGAP